MQARWAALLANAAAAGEGADVLPSFPRLLAELVPVEARMLEMIAESDWGSTPVWAFAEPLGYDPRNEVSGQAYSVHVDNLERLNLCTITRPDRELHRFAEQLERERRAQARGVWPPPVGGRRLGPLPFGPTVALSALGRAFVAACTPPTGTQGADGTAD